MTSEAEFQIQSLAKFYNEQLMSTVLKRRKKRPGMARFKKTIRKILYKGWFTLDAEVCVFPSRMHQHKDRKFPISLCRITTIHCRIHTSVNEPLDESWLKPVWQDWAIYYTLGNHSKHLATINLPKSPTFLSNFCKGVKIIVISGEIIFEQLL